MKKITIGLFIVFLILWVPYFIQTYNLETLSESDLPAEGAWASLEEGMDFQPLILSGMA